jgi:hypothetical protein
MHPIFVDVRQDLAEAAAEARLLDQARERCARVVETSSDPVERWIYVNAVASGIEKAYGGVERALARIARDVDRHVPGGPAWHADLLRRLSVELPGRRPAVISRAVYQGLDELRGFRHRERNSYVRDLDPRRVIEIAGGVLPTLDALSREVDALEGVLDPAASGAGS